MRSKKLTVLTLIILMLSPAFTLASGSKSQNLPEPKPALKNEQPSANSGCALVLSKCDKALESQRKLNHEQQKLIKAQDNLTLTQREKIDQLTRERNSIFRSPYLWFGLGLIGGIIITK